MEKQAVLKNHPPAKRRSSTIARFIGGIAFTLIIALLSMFLSNIPGLDRLGSLACAILLAVVYRQIWGYPETIRTGIQFVSKKLLRLAIILFGLKLNLDVVLHQGLGLLVLDACTIIFSILLMLLLAKWFKADASLSLILGIGTGVCGAAAIAATSPILKSKDEDTAIGIGLIALIGTIFAMIYTALRPFLPIDELSYGIWSGISLHEIAHVALAAEPAGQDALSIALLAKLGRVLLLVPLSFILIFWMKYKRKNDVDTKAKIEFPWFLVGFIVMSLLGSFISKSSIDVPAAVMDGTSFVTSFLLTMAMIGLGLNVHFKAIRSKAMRPLLAMGITSVLLSLLTFFML